MKLNTLLLSFLLVSAAAVADPLDNIPKIVVKGEASIHKEVDQMEVHLGVVTRSLKSSDDALNQNRKMMNQVLQNLNEIGLEESEYQTCQFHIQPFYKKSKEGETESLLISGYEVYNAIKVNTLKLELADKILTAAVKGGVNQINQINFSLHNPQLYRSEVIQAATHNAIADANALASAAGVKIKRIINLTLNHWQNLPNPYILTKSANGGAVDFGNDPIEPGKAEINATVNVIFEIES